MRGLKNFFKLTLLVILALSIDAQSQTTHILKKIAEDEIADIYGSDGTNRQRIGQWRGDCGRGKFFYNNPTKFPPKDSNLFPILTGAGSAENLQPEDATINTNDIWHSRTGCWNPEERLVHMPPYSTFVRGRDMSASGTPNTCEDFDTHGQGAPDRVRNNILFYEPTGNKNKNYIANKSKSGAFCSATEGPPDEPIGASATGVIEYVVPNDRLLMPHPLCTNLTAGSREFYAPTGVQLKGDITKLIDPWIKDLFEKEDVEDRVKKFGSLPRCLIEDKVDDLDNYCEEYLKDNTAFSSVSPLTDRYTTERYFFNFTDFCWDQDSQPIALAYDPYEHWMPLAIKSTTDEEVSGSNPEGWNKRYGDVEREDFEGIEHKYIKTDIRRPALTEYAERTVFDETALDDNEHTQFSLEEYGYRDTPFRKRDYNFDPNNIYEPQATPITPNELLLSDNIGRKAKMFKCLRMYIEQWAFEGDKGSIYLDKTAYANRLGVGNDATMCQWAAYYDTSANYDEREHFQKVMLHFFEDNGDGDGIDFRRGLLGGAVPGRDVITKDPENLRADGKHEFDDRTPPINLSSIGLPAAISEYFSLDTQNTFNMKRKVGMRPEAFDYFNFLTFSALPTAGAEIPGLATNMNDLGWFGTAAEKFDISHNVNLSGGGAGHTVDSIGNITGTITLKDLYGTIPDIGSAGTALGTLGINRVNLAKRECKTAIPPNIWNDVVDMNSLLLGTSPLNQCDFRKGARNINSLSWPLFNNVPEELQGIVDPGVDPVFVRDNTTGREYTHWLTTLVDAPILSLVTPMPTLPVIGVGWTYADGIETPIPYTDVKTTNPQPLQVVEARDNWHRPDAERIIPYHVVQPLLSNRNFYEDGASSWIVVDEKYGFGGSAAPRARDWVNHSWPARSCMHSWQLDAGNVPNYKKIKKDAADPSINPDEYLDKIYTSWKTFDDIRLDYLAGAAYDFSNGTYKYGMDRFESDQQDAEANTSINNRKFGGFRMRKANLTDFPRYYFSWLPTKWSVGVGIYKAFWCEFELPYFPYVAGDAEWLHNKVPIFSFFNVNGQNGSFGENKLEFYDKPRLEYYRVERIRDGCGPFGVRSTWIDYEKNLGHSSSDKVKFFDWFIGDISTRDTFSPDENYLIDKIDNNGDQYYHLESRCDGWIDMYRKRTNNPKAIGWRLARFDYEFMKSFLECTGPYRRSPNVCNYNVNEHNDNKAEAVCQIAMAYANRALGQMTVCLPFPPFCQKLEDWRFPRVNVQCGGALVKQLLGDLIPGCHSAECTNNNVNEDITDNLARAVDYSTRGDSTFKHYEADGESHGFVANDNDIEESPGFETWKSNSIRIDKFWLRGAFDDYDVSPEEPFGFWCKCPPEEIGNNPSTSSKTTRCSEDDCTCDQHVLFPSRWTDGPFSPNGALGGSNTEYKTALATIVVMQLISKAPKLPLIFLLETLPIELMAGTWGILPGKPMTICADYGPFRRWIQCFYNARASACPVLTRDVSDSIPYSTLKDPFTQDKRAKDNIPENTQRRQSFNVCQENDPIGHGDKDIEGFVRWSLEEPNHLARLPVWFESAGAGYAHHDLIFQSQVRDWESPFMELAVPFPIDLITRHCGVKNRGGAGEAPLWGERRIDEGKGEVDVEACRGEEEEGVIGLKKKVENDDDEYPNNLSEIMQREGLGYQQIIYYNAPNIGELEPPTDEFEVTDPWFRSSFLKTRDTRIITPVVESIDCLLTDVDPATGLKCDSKRYQEVYLKYVKGLYAASAGFSFAALPEEPFDPTILSDPQYSDPASPDYDPNDPRAHGTDVQNLHPRAQDKIVGPRGCDIGGWWEMMLYQARCIRWHALNCICDYDKTFAKGNSVNYALRRAGAEFEVIAPTVIGAEYELGLDIGQDGIVYTDTGEAELNNDGTYRNRVFGEKRTRELELPKKPVKDPITGRFKLKTEDGLGNSIDTLKKYKPGVVVSKTPRIFPLKDRGILGPEFAINNTEDWDSTGHKLVGLDNVRVGDIVIWDEQITEPVTGLDIGYPRHAAYVESVTRLDESSGHMAVSFKVSEMNWGKIHDSCGNTNKWGIESERIIHRPTCGSDSSTTVGDPNYCPYPLKVAATPSGPGNPAPAPNPGSIDRYADCRNADWYHCVEKYWDQVKIYRPYINATGKYDNDVGGSSYTNPAVSDPAYDSSCQLKSDFPQPISLASYNALATNLFGSVHTPPDVDLLKKNGVFDPVKVRDYIILRYEDGTLTLDEILYDTDLWKLLVTTSDFGKYYDDEVNEFLFNPLKGAADNCDPRPQDRKNYESVLKEVQKLL